jgi:ATP-binding cassette subfamily B protein
MSSNLRPIWNLMAGQRARFGSAVAAMVLASALLYLSPLVPQIALDGVLSSEPERASGFVTRAVDMLGGRAHLGDRLWILALLMAGITMLAGAFTYLRSRLSARASEELVRRLRDEVYDHLQRLPASYFDEAETGDLIQRCTSDVETVRTFLETQVVEVGRALIMVIIPIPLMLAIDGRMTAAAMALIPLVLGFSAAFFLRVKRAFKVSEEAEAAMTATLQENLTGIRVVRAFARQDHECERFAQDNARHRRASFDLYRLQAWYWATSDLMTFMQKALVVGVGLWLLAQGELQVGAFFFFLTATTMFVYPVRMMGRILTDLGKAAVALGRLGEILETPVEASPDREAQLPEPVRGHLRFSGVHFSHGDSPVLQDVSFEVPAGTTLGILGASGSGKTTIVELLLRLYDHDEGTIELDGVDITGLDRTTLRSKMAVAMQQPFLFSKTIAQNVSLGRPDATHEEVVRSTSVACVHENIVDFDDGYDTAVGERGVTLSGGQRQRVALARALLQQPAILILDDALSAIDTETETMILSALRRRSGRHTTLVVAHRLSSLIAADQILVLDQGRVIQRGTHTELSNQPGLYRRLWRIQSGADEHPISNTPTASGGG